MRTIIGFSVAFVIIFVSYFNPRVMLNPGQLTVKHQDLKDNCTSCHQPFRGIDNDNCISCHKLSEIGKNNTGDQISDVRVSLSMFHTQLKDSECSSCHTDHEGIDSKITKKGFDHDLLNDELKENCSGCHNKPLDKLHEQLSVNCYSCHNTDNWKLAGSFDHNMIKGANKNECSSCHTSPEDNFHISIKDNCSKCHSTDKWKPSSFDHSMYFVLDKNHDSKCITCHSGNNFAEYTCYGCHEHNERDMFRKHSEENINDISDCASCHKSGNEHDIKGRDGKEFNKGSDNEQNSGEKEFRKEKDKKEKKERDHDESEEDDD